MKKFFSRLSSSGSASSNGGGGGPVLVVGSPAPDHDYQQHPHSEKLGSQARFDDPSAAVFGVQHHDFSTLQTKRRGGSGRKGSSGTAGLFSNSQAPAPASVSAGPPPPPAKDKVKALAARYEGLNGVVHSAGQSTAKAEKGARGVKNGSRSASAESAAAAAASKPLPDLVRGLESSSAAPPIKSLPLSVLPLNIPTIAEPTLSTSPLQTPPESARPIPSLSGPAEKVRASCRPRTPTDPNGISGTQPKQVAFAPSPVKLSASNAYGPRARSPSADSFARANATLPGEFAGNDNTSADTAASSGPTSFNFARPTASSAAKARGASMPGERVRGASGTETDADAMDYVSFAPLVASVSSSSRARAVSSGPFSPGTPVIASLPQHLTSTGSVPSSVPAVRSNSLSGTSARRKGSSHASEMVSQPALPSAHTPGHSHGSSLGSNNLPTNSIPFRSASPMSMQHSGPAAGTALGSNSMQGHLSSSAFRRTSSIYIPGVATSSMRRRPSTSGEIVPSRRRESRDRTGMGAGNASEDDASSFISFGAKSVGGPSWSEMTQEELVMNLGSRERTRQEVLWEIVASEERYVLELEKTKDLYVDALLHPLRFSPPTTPRESVHAGTPISRVGTSERNFDALPIASRFASAHSGLDQKRTSSSSKHSDEKVAGSFFRPASRANSGGAGNMLALSHTGRSNFAKGLGIASPGSKEDPEPISRPSSRRKTARRSSASVFGMAVPSTSSQATKPGDPFNLGINVPLPDSLRLVLESLSEGLLTAHAELCEALRVRYDQQWPLVRSLADVFMHHSHILKHYATYVCHLQRALEHVEEAMLMERAMRGKRIKKDKLSQTVALGRAIAVLEAFAFDHGETGGLAIFICKPFQRLLKYPLLFQNLLFHTDPSTYEFESTVEMVVEVERIVRSIEDEKVSAEERDQVRDAFARIDGISDRRLLKPQPDRILIDEKALFDQAPKRALSETSPASPSVNRGNGLRPSHSGNASDSDNSDASGMNRSLRDSLKSKRSYRRLSDFLTTDPKSKSTKAPNIGSKKDLWVVRFSDVELRCQRVGTTALPMASSIAIRPDGSREDIDEAGEESMTKRSKESKERLKALRNTTLRAKTRNLYKFIAIQSWKTAEKTQGENAAEETFGLSTALEEAEELSDSGDSSEEVVDLDRYVRQSKLSFSYWGQDKVEPTLSSAGTTKARNTGSPHAASVVANRSQNLASPVSSDLRSTSQRTASGSAAVVDSTAVVSNSHNKAHVEKFAGRLRESSTPPLSSSSRRASVQQHIERSGSGSASTGKGHPASTTSLQQPVPQLPRNNFSIISLESGVPFSPSGLQWPSSPPRE